MSEEKKDVKDLFVQYLFIQLADGRRGVFMGPELISASELKTNPPKISELVFTEPKPRTQLEDIINGKKEEGVQPKEDNNTGTKKDLVL